MRSYAFLIFFLLSLLSPRPLGAQDEPVSKSLRIGDLTAPLSREFWLGPLRLWQASDHPWDEGSRMLAGLSFQARDWPEDPEKPTVAVPFLDPDTIRYLLAVTGKAAGETGSFSQKKGELRFSGSQMGLATAQARIQELRRRLSAPIQVEFALYREAEPTASGLTWLTMDAAEKAMSEFRRADRIGLILHEQASVRPGDLVYMGERRSRTFLADYNVEIAEGTKSLDPVVRRIRCGNGLTLVFETSPDGQSLGLHFEISLRSVPDKVDSIPIGTEDIESLERIRYESHRIMANLTLPQEAAFVYVPGGATEGSPDARIHALFIVRRKSTPPGTQSGAVLLPYGSLTSHLSRTHAPTLSDARLPPPLEEQELMEILQRSTETSQGARLSVPVMDGRHMILTGTPEILSRALARLDTQSRARSTSYIVRLGREAWVAGAWKAQGADLALPLMAWRSAAFIHGSAMSYLADLNTEVAKDAKVLDPSLGMIFQGMAAQISIIPVQDKLEVLLELQETRLDELRRVKMKSSDKGSLEAPGLTQLERSREYLIAPGVKRVLGSGMDQILEGKQVKTRYWIQIEKLGTGK